MITFLLQVLVVFLIVRIISGLIKPAQRPKHSGPPPDKKGPVTRFDASGKNIADADYEDV